MLGLVIRMVEAPISLSLSVMRRGAEIAGRAAGWALNEVARELAPDRPRSSTPPTPTESPARSAAPEPPAPPAAPAAPEPPRAAAPEAPSTPEPGPAPVPPTDATDPEVSGASDIPTPGPDTEDVSGGEEGEAVEDEPGLGTSVRAQTPHSALNNPVTEPDLTEWPDPYEQREDPRDPGEEMVFGGDAGHTPPGAISTSEPHPSQDPEAAPWEGPKRDRVDQ